LNLFFAGGLPGPETFPVEEIEDICCKMSREKGALALQYGPTEGENPFREEIAKWLRRDDGAVKLDNVLVRAGSQQGLDIISKILLDPNDIIAVELPTYIMGLRAFTAYRAKMIGVPLDDEGMKTSLLKDTLARLAKKGKKMQHSRVSLI
jgi:2-aminoadipate transaminase